MPLKWTFPPTGGGVAHGFNDSAQEHFRNDAWKHTIRELIQNSLDAVRNTSKPVVVEITVGHIPSSELGALDLAKHVKQALNRTKAQGEQQGEKFYTSALRILKSKKIKTLSVKDTNTTGLVDGRWDALVYNEGTTNKGGMGAAGGSFGLGKNAPYLVSELKTVCYSTYYATPGREERFIARCKLIAHDDPEGHEGELQHIGFGTKGKVPRNKHPLPTRGQNIYKDFRLGDVGSGIFIAGFNPLSKNWFKVAERSIAESFFEAIHTEKLRIKLENKWITRDTLDTIFEQDPRNRSFYYYHIVRDDPCVETAHIETDLGQFTLKFYIGEDGMPNRIAYINRRGMLVTDTGQRGTNPFHKSLGRGWAKYAAVVVASNDKTDKKIREMEPPNHGTIEPGRIIDPKRREEMETALTVVRDKIATIIDNALRLSVQNQEINVTELADIMPIDGDESDGQGKETQEGSKSLTSRKLKLSNQSQAVQIADDDDDDSDKPAGSNERRKKRRNNPRKRKDKSVPTLEKIRIMRVNGKMRVAFTPVKNTGAIQFSIRPAGEELVREQNISINKIKVIGDNIPISIKNKNIVLTPKDGKRVTMDITVNDEIEGYTGYQISCAPKGGSK